MQRSVVGIIPLYDEKKKSLWMLPGYEKMLERFGAVPIMLPLTEDLSILGQCISLCDGLLFPGGHDVSPALYGEEKSGKCGPVCVTRDTMEIYLLKEALRTNRPVLGICRGIQLINVSFGGSLYQDLPSQQRSDIDHHMSPPYDRPVHRVRITKSTLLYDILGKEEILVNSYHHQAIKTPGKTLRIDAVAPDGLIEAVDLPEKKFFLAIQWHPEFNWESDGNSRKIIAAFVKSL